MIQSEPARFGVLPYRNGHFRFVGFGIQTEPGFHCLILAATFNPVVDEPRLSNRLISAARTAGGQIRGQSISAARNRRGQTDGRKKIFPEYAWLSHQLLLL